MKQFIPVVALLLGIASTPVSAGRWDAPHASVEPAQLPRLARSLVIDGSLEEWGGAACVPVRSGSYVTVNARGNWAKPRGTGMEFYCAWNAQGLCAAAVVVDDDVCNDRQPKDYWQQDCVEFLVDGRGSGRFMKSPYSKGAYQILLRPPANGRAAAAVNARDGSIPGLQVAGKVTSHGYTIEALIPWSAFPEMKPREGSSIGLQFALDDYDRTDGDTNQPVQLVYQAAKDVWNKPEQMTKWTLTEKLQTGPDAFLGPLAVIDIPAMTQTLWTSTYTVEFASTISDQVRSVEFVAVDGYGRRVIECKSPVWRMSSPWQSSAMTRVSWDLGNLPDGYYTIKITAYDAQGRPLGYATRPTLLAGNTVRSAASILAKADVPALAQSKPFAAAAYMGAAACAEKFKWEMYRSKLLELPESARELDARLDVLADGRLDAKDAGLYDLIALTGEPDAQVVVEYPHPNQAGVTLLWGSVPVGRAMVMQMAPSDAAARAGKARSGQVLVADRDRLIEVSCASTEAAKRIAAMVIACKPIKAADVDRVRIDVVKALSSTVKPGPIPPGVKLFCGDLHMHTSYSDGRCTPAGLMLEAMYCGMDYAVMSDHNTIEGAQSVRRTLADYGFGFLPIVGEEITTQWSHFNAYPLTQRIAETGTADDFIAQAHAQGAVIQWNHPAAVKSDWTDAHLDTDIGTIGLDAWEHVMPDFDKRKAEGKMKLVVGTSDTHFGTFECAERTIVYAPSTDGSDVADAIRCGRAVAVVTVLPGLFYGADDVTAAAYSALVQGAALKEAKSAQLKQILRKADAAGLLLDRRE